MKTLLGKSRMDAIKQVKKDVKSAKSAGLSSPSDRKKEMQQYPKAAPEKKKKSSEPALAGLIWTAYFHPHQVQAKTLNLVERLFGRYDRRIKANG